MSGKYPIVNHNEIVFRFKLHVNQFSLYKQVKAGIRKELPFYIGFFVIDNINIVEIAIEKEATGILMPVSCRRQLIDLFDDMAIKIDIQFYSGAKDAFLKAIVE